MSVGAVSEITIRCQDCLWEFTGAGAEARAEWNDHRYSEHDDYQPPPKGEATGSPQPAVNDSVNKRQPERAPEPVTHPSRSDASRSSTSNEEPKREALALIQAFHAEHGRPPMQREISTGALYALKKHLGTFADAIEAAGFERPTRGHRRNRSGTAKAAPPPKPTAKGQPKRTPASPITPEPAPEQGPQGTSEGTLVELAQRVADLSERRQAMLAEIAALEAELGTTIDECAAALDAERVEAA